MPQRTRPAKTKRKIDLMSITVLLVMAIFGGIVGYYVGLSSGSNQMFEQLQTNQLIQTK